MLASTNSLEGLLFPAEWVRSALVLALISAWVVIALFAYVNYTTRKGYLSLWIVGWMFYSIYLAAAIGLTEMPDTAFLVMARCACIGISALFMFWGSFYLIDCRRSQRELAFGTVLAVAWSYISAYQVGDRLWISVPVFTLLATAGFVIGWLYWRRRGHSRGARILGAGFLLWGVHLMAFPFASLSPGFEATVYVASCLFAGLISMGMILESQAALSEQDYRALFDSATDATFLLDPATMQVLESNAAAHRLTGRSATDLAGSSFGGLTPDVYEGLTTALNEEEFSQAAARLSSEFRIAGSNGNLIDCSGRASIAHCPRGTVLHLTVQDISKSKRRRIRLAAQHAVTRVLAESPTLHEAWPRILEAICQNLKWDIGVLWCFDSAAELLSYGEVWHEPTVSAAVLKAVTEQKTLAPGVELPGRVCNSVLPGWLCDALGNDLHPRARNAAAAGWRASLAFPIRRGWQCAGVIELFRREYRQPDDDEVEMFKAMGNQIGQFSKRKEAETAVREAEIKYRSLVEQLPAIVYTAEFGSNGHRLYISPQVHSLLGFSPAEWLTADSLWFDQVHPDDRDRVLAEEARCRDTGDGFSVEYRMIGRDGSVVWFSDRAAPVRDDGGRPRLLQGVMFDISDRKRAEEALRESHRQLERALADLRKTQQQLVQQERLRALGQMASGVAHDFNNAVAKILGFNELLLASPEHLRDEAKVRQYLQMTNTAAQDAANVVRRLREFYRKREETDIFHPIDLNALIQQAISLAEPKWKRQAQASGVNIKIETGLNEVPLIAGNAADLREILTNLIFNAVDAMPKGGIITLSSRAADGHVLMEISDTGAGMPEEVRAHCFEPFFSTKGDAGTGLGLAIVYGIVKRHSGKIEVRSETNRGTTFIVTLPEYKDKLVAKAASHDEVSESALSVLIVEDEPILQDITAQYLVCDGHTVETAANGTEALDKFHSRPYDLVITDWAMPEMNGDQLAAAIKRVRPATPVILMTGFSDIRGESTQKIENADIVLGKPFTHAGLRHAVTKVTTANPQLSSKGRST